MQHKVIDANDVVIRFAGDSGDGMQLTGTLFANMSAIYGNGLSTFPDYPAEIRAPKGTVAGVSGFQVHIGNHKVNTPGDFCDMLVAMNPAALKANAKWLKRNALVLVNENAFDDLGMKKAGKPVRGTPYRGPHHHLLSDYQTYGRQSERQRPGCRVSPQVQEYVHARNGLLHL